MDLNILNNILIIKRLKFKVGDQVEILSKTVPGFKDGDIDFYKNNKQYITRIDGDGSGKNGNNAIVVNKDKNSCNGNYFRPQDLKLINK
jgi:hypothetical protein